MPGVDPPSHRDDSMRTQAGALAALTRSWPTIVEECRGVLGSELHYQAVLYHCLRTVGRVPSEQLGMNVKMWISDVVSNYFKARDLRKPEDFQGGFEPIPDIVIFKPESRGDFRRRNYFNTLRQMLLDIEIKASERHQGRLRPGEVVEDVLKLDALRLEVKHRKSNVLPALIVLDTAPTPVERMTNEAVDAAKSAAEERGVCFFYLSQEQEFYVTSAGS